MGVPPPLAELRCGVGLSATKSRVSEGRGRACADYAERERLHCEAIIFCTRTKTKKPHKIPSNRHTQTLCKRIFAAIPNATHRSTQSRIISYNFRPQL
ncbi:MAG: hypothetical protein LBQ31_07340 [Bacteroidales bacterium]|nr:hypothetical protein [Bacteroidales bacterium]